MVQLLADEHIRRSVIQGLSRRGIPTRAVQEEGLGGVPDAAILAFASEEERVLLTNDEDFLQLADEHRHHGIIFQTSQFVEPGPLLRSVVRLVDTHPPEAFPGSVFFVP